ncbi:MAG: beta-galactosidase [Armatimonadota bacterium]
MSTSTQPVCVQVPDAYSVDTPWSSWNSLPAIRLTPHKDFHPNGDSDLSGEVILAWNSNFLFVVARVTDDHFNPYDSVSGFWNGDSIQFALAPNTSVESDAKSAIFLGAADFPFGRKVVVTGAPIGLPTGIFDIPFNTIHEGNVLTYIVALPWRYAIRVNPLSDEGIRFNLIVNDNDGSGRRGWVQLSDGIGDGSDVSKFPVVKFVRNAVHGVQVQATLSELSVDNDGSVDVSVVVRDAKPGMKVRVTAGKWNAERYLDDVQPINSIPFSTKSVELGVVGEVSIRVDVIDSSSVVQAVSDTAIIIKDTAAALESIELARSSLVLVDSLTVKTALSGKRLDYIELRANCLRYALRVTDLIKPKLAAGDESARGFEKINENIIRYVKKAATELISDARAADIDNSSRYKIRKPVLNAQWSIRDGDLFAGSEPVMISGVVWTYGNKDSSFRLRDLGMNAQTIDVGPSIIIGDNYDIKKDLLSTEPIGFWRRVAKEGQDNGEVFDLHTSPHYTPGWFKPDNHNEWMGTPDGQRLLEQTYKGLAQAFDDIKAIKTADLANEWTYWSTSPASMRDFRTWLKGGYRTIGKLNANWGTNLASFDVIPSPFQSIDANTMNAPKGVSQPMNPEGIYRQRGPYWDWCRFNTMQAASKVRWMHQTFKKSFPELFTQIKCVLSSREYRTLADNYLMGINPELILPITDLIGTDASYTRGVMWKGTIFSYDYMKSICLDKPIICTEMHAPPYDDAAAPSEIRRGLFQRFVHGERFNLVFLMVTTGVIDWWAQSFEGSNMNTWNIGACPETLESIAVTSADLQRLAKEFTAFTKRQPDVLIFYDNAADFGIPGSGEPQGRYCDRAIKVYESLIYRNVRTGFVTESMLTSKAPTAPMIIVTGAQYISDKALKSLSEYVKKGGVLLCLGDNFQYNHYGIKRQFGALGVSSWIINMPIKADAREYSSIWPKLFQFASIRPPFITKGADGDIAWGVEIKSAKMANGRQLVFLANTNSSSVEFNLISTGKVKMHYIDLITSKPVYGDSVKMAANQVMLLSVDPDAVKN